MQMIDNYSFAGKKVIIRVDFNVPLGAQYEVTDDTRIRGALPTIKKVLKDGGSAILMSHLGRPKAGPEEKFSLKHIIPVLSGHLGMDVQFADDCMVSITSSSIVFTFVFSGMNFIVPDSNREISRIS